MDIRIGIVQSMKELDVELPDDADRDKVMKEVEEALAGDGQRAVADRSQRSSRGRARESRIAYVELGTPASDRVVGFGAA